jgi:hypothetical protein
MHNERISTRVRLVMTVVGFLGILTLSLFGSGWPTPSETAHGQTIPTDVSGDTGGGSKDPTATPRLVASVPSLALTQTPSPVQVSDPGEIAVKPGESSSGESVGRRCGVIVTSGDINEPGTILLPEVPVDALTNRNKRYVYVRACDVQFRNQGGQISTVYAFANPLSVCFPYTDEDLVRAQNKVALLTILTFDAAKNQWVELPVTLDAATRQVCGQLSQTGLAVLAVKSSQAAALPNTSGNMPEGTPVVSGAPAAPAPTAVLAPAAGNAAPVQPVAESVPTAALAPAAGNAAPAQSVTAPAPENVSGVSPVLMVIGLLVAVLIAVAILVLSRGFLTRSTEE